MKCTSFPCLRVHKMIYPHEFIDAKLTKLISFIYQSHNGQTHKKKCIDRVILCQYHQIYVKIFSVNGNCVNFWHFFSWILPFALFIKLHEISNSRNASGKPQMNYCLWRVFRGNPSRTAVNCRV